jgi:hypothetical protein
MSWMENILNFVSGRNIDTIKIFDLFNDSLSDIESKTYLVVSGSESHEIEFIEHLSSLFDVFLSVIASNINFVSIVW